MFGSIEMLLNRPWNDCVDESDSDMVHRWHKSVMGFPSSLVRELISALKIDGPGYLLDPFCGTGTTLVEGKLAGVTCIGVDSNPVSVETSWAKTCWELDPERLAALASEILEKRGQVSLERGPRGKWPLSVVERGWLRSSVANEAQWFLQEIDETASGDYSRFLAIAFVWSIKESASNVKFGPEAYKVVRRGRISIEHIFSRKILQIVHDLEHVQRMSVRAPTFVLNGDSREIDRLLEESPGVIKWAIASPPYPTEHDYARISRIELELLGMVKTAGDLRAIKQSMLRSNSKTVYSTDNDYGPLKECEPIGRIIARLRGKAQQKKYGFARQYPKVIGEYFGGLYRHLLNLGNVMPKDGRCAYVLGQECSYFGCFVPTADLVAHMCRRHGLPFDVVAITDWKTRRASRGTRRKIKEQILFLKRK